MPTSQVQKQRSLLDGASDWLFSIDFEEQKLVFPPEIYSTSERPDIVIWSGFLKLVIMIELTCPSEEGITNATNRKQRRYGCLLDNIRPQWTPILFIVEVGARGYVANSMVKCLRRLGFSNRRTHLTTCEKDYFFIFCFSLI